MRRALALLSLAAVAALVWWGWQRRSQPPSVPFAKVRRETLVSTLTTNGKVEPGEWQSVRAEAAGVVERVPVADGTEVHRGDTLAVLSATGLETALRAAEARIAEARAELAAIDRGGPATDVAEIENALARARNERESARRELDTITRLEAKQAATRAELEAARNRVRAAEIELESLERRRAALGKRVDRAAGEARLREAEAAAAAARERIGQTVIRSPMDGVVYELAARPGGFLNAGDMVANVGRLQTMRVRVYVDEPELGRVAVGQPVTITWDALPGKSWQGTVERKPAAIETLGTRNVGEVLCSIDNTGRELAAGANVNAEIRTATVRDALVIPKEAVRRDARGTGVYLLEGESVSWRSITLGASSVTHVQVTSGLKEADAVALPTEAPLQSGQIVRPHYP
jgi:HlyD family secretion protein